MYRARSAIAVLVSAFAVVSVGGRAFAGVEVFCGLTGTVSLDPDSASVRIGFTGVTNGCTDVGVDGTIVRLDGRLSCGTSDGTARLTLEPVSGVPSLATTVVSGSTPGIAVLGTLTSGAYEGAGIAAMLAVVAPLDSCTSSRATSGPSPGIIHVGPNLLGTGPSLGVEPPMVGDPWSTKDEGDNTIDQNFRRCPVPGDMYSDGDHSACKYDQAWAATRCTRTRQVSTGGTTSEKVCTQKQLTQFAYRGGTANTRTPQKSGRCALGTPGTDTQEWHLYRFRVARSRDGQPIYDAPSTHYGYHYNCDVEGQRFYGNPNPITMDEDHQAEFTWAHFPCGYLYQCDGQQGFVSTLTFGIGVPS